MTIHEEALPDFVREHDIDQVTLDIIENALGNIRYEMNRVLVTTAVSPVIREQADETAGAGGLGDPLERDPEKVARDVRWNLVSREAAEEEYGVVLDDRGEVDTKSTEARREELEKGCTYPLPEFDHGPLPSLEEQRKIVSETRRRFDEWLSEELGGSNGKVG